MIVYREMRRMDAPPKRFITINKITNVWQAKPLLRASEKRLSQLSNARPY